MQFRAGKSHFMTFSETYTFANGTTVHEGCEYYVVEYLKKGLNMNLE